MKIDTEKCIGCGECIKECFIGAIKLNDDKAIIDKRRCILCGHCIAVCPINAAYSDEYDMNEVKEYSEKDFNIDSETLLNFIKFRRSIRRFTDKEVEEEKLLKIIEAGRFTQTAGNQQDVLYILVRKKISTLRDMTIKNLKNLGDKILSDSQNSNPIFKKYAKMWLKMYEDHKIDPVANDRLFFNAPAVLIVAAGIQVNADLASSNMELMADSLGLGSMFSGFFIRACTDNKEIYDFLKVPEGKMIYTCMTLGYPDVKYLRTVPRKKPNILNM